ncbi:MAG: zinc-binding alcohol dehydrogenase family protein [Chitinophagales bacterium]
MILLKKMKAAVIHKFGDTPKYQDFPDPIAGQGEKLIEVKASALENLDKMLAAGTHYASRQMLPEFPVIVGHGGIGTTEDGQLVGFGKMHFPYGSFAEKTIAGYIMPISSEIDPALAAALPASVLTSYLPLKYSAKFESGETLLINGATGFSGRIAIQLAKMLGAGRVVGTGRNETSWQTLKNLGADAFIDLKQSDEKILKNIQKEAGENGYDVVIDFIWGHPAELIMKSIIPSEIGLPKKRIRYVHVGEKAGSFISLSGEMLRTSGLEIYGAANISREELSESVKLVWDWIKENKFQADIEQVPLADIEKAWMRNDLDGKRIVIVP